MKKLYIKCICLQQGVFLNSIIRDDDTPADPGGEATGEDCILFTFN